MPSPSEQGLSQEDKVPKPFPKLELLKTMQLEAEGLIAERVKSGLVHSTKNIVAAGGVVESAVREVLRKRLPVKYYVGQGHIVNPMLKTSGQFDVIVASNDGFPVLFQDGNGTEWFPFEGVYAVGEVKSSYDQSKRHIESFSRKIRRTKAELNWPKSRAVFRAFEKGGVEFQNDVTFDRLFSFMVFVESSDFKTERLAEFYRNTPVENLPNILYLVDKGVMINMKFGGIDGEYPMEMNIYPEVADKIGLVQYKSKWCLRMLRDDNEEVGLGMAFFAFYYLLMSHLKDCNLRPFSLMPYYVLSTVDVGPTMNLDIMD